MTLTRSFLVLAVLSGSAAPASAQSASAQAETLFRQAKDLFDAGKIADACAAFDSSQKLDPQLTTLFSLATCREKNGQLATAWGLFVEDQRQARNATDAASQQWGELSAAAAARLEPKLSKLTITVSPEHAIAGLEVRREADIVDAGAWNHPLPIDGGTYKITARAPGHDEWTTTVTVKPDSDTQAIEVPALAVAAAAPAVSVARRSRVLPLAVGGGAIVLGGAAIGFELWAEHFNNQIAGAMDNTTRLDLWHSANARRYTAEGLGIAAIASAGTAVYLYVRHGKESQTQVARGIEIVPLASGQVAGLQLDGNW